MYLADDFCEVGPRDIRHREVCGYLLVEPLLVEGGEFSSSNAVDEPLPARLGLDKVFLDFLVGNWEVRAEVFSEYGFVRMLG